MIKFGVGRKTTEIDALVYDQETGVSTDKNGADSQTSAPTTTVDNVIAIHLNIQASLVTTELVP